MILWKKQKMHGMKGGLNINMKTNGIIEQYMRKEDEGDERNSTINTVCEWYEL